MSLQNSHQISDVKVMLVKGVDGKGIASIEKTGTQGLVDTYTINFTDGTKTTFTVTNGAGGGMSALLLMTSEAGSEISVTSPSGRSLVVTQVSGSSTIWQCETTEYGVHTISSVLSGETATTSVDVDTCKIYNISALLFSASITVSYPEGATCTCTKEGGSPVTALSNPYTFVVGSAGNYTITVLANGETYTSTVSITTNGQTETLTMPVGSTVTPTDSITTLLACAGIVDENITTLSELLSDTTTLQTVISSNNAIDYLVRSTTWATDMCADSTAMSYIGLNNYASNTLLADSTWCSAICNSTYFESVLNVKVPTMTSNNTPSGECSSENITITSGYEIWKAFDNDVLTEVHGVSSNWARFIYNFSANVKIIMATIYPRYNNDGLHLKRYKIQKYSNSAWVDMTDTITLPNQNITEPIKNILSSTERVSKYCIYGIDSYAYFNNQNTYAIKEIQFYGRADV